MATRAVIALKLASCRARFFRKKSSMVKPLLTYPDPKVRLISANVRFFDEQLRQWIADMRETMIANNLEALSAILIGIQYSVIVMKEGDDFIPYINARIVRHDDVVNKTERSLYYPKISADIDRYEYISIVYEDENGEFHTKELRGDVARVFQAQLDYCFGSTFVDRVDKEMKQRINDHLEYGLVADGGSCPTVFVRDYFKRGAKLLMIGVVLTYLAVFFASPKLRELIYTADVIALAVVPLVILGYGIYALYEAKKYKQCTSCQTGNIVGTSVILFFQLLVVALGVFFLVRP